MGQQICMNEDAPFEDIDKLRDMTYDLMNYGILHEDCVNPIDKAFAMIIIEKKPELFTEQAAAAKAEEYMENYDSEEEAIAVYIEEYEGSLYEVIDKLNQLEDTAEVLEYAKIYRDIVYHVIASDSYLSEDKLIEIYKESLEES